MNIKRIIATSALVGSIFIVSEVTTHASNVNSLKTIPKSIQGTWYSYDDGKLSTATYYKNKIVTNYNGQNHTSYVYKYNDHKANSKKQTNNWSFIITTKKIDGYKWFKIYGWNQGTGAGDYLSVNKFNGNEVLSSAGDAGVEVYGQYYRTPNLAKQLANKHYPNFKYMDTKA